MDDREIRWHAVEVAYRDHADDVYRIALAILRDPEAAVDATHDTFARAFDRWHQYDENRPLRAWLHGIVSHAALDALRRRRVRTLALPRIGEVRETASAAGPAGDPARHVAERDQIDAGPRRSEARGACRPRAPSLLRLRLRRDRTVPADELRQRRLDPEPQPRHAPRPAGRRGSSGRRSTDRPTGTAPRDPLTPR